MGNDDYQATFTRLFDIGDQQVLGAGIECCRGFMQAAMFQGYAQVLENAGYLAIAGSA